MNEKEIFDIFVNNFHLIRKQVGEESMAISKSEALICSYDEYKEKNKESFDWYIKHYSEKEFVKRYDEKLSDSQNTLAFIEKIGEDVLEISRDREDSSTIIIFKINTLYIKAMFPYDSYDGTDYKSGDFYMVLPRKVEVIQWEEI